MKHNLQRGLLRRTLEGLCLAALAEGFLLPIALWGRIPDRIPGHYNAAGEIDRWTGKWELFLLPAFGVILYMMLSAAGLALRPGLKRGELPPSAPAWLAGIKLAVLAGFAWIGGSMALCRPLPGSFTAVFMAAALVPVTGFLVSAICFAAKGKAG